MSRCEHRWYCDCRLYDAMEERNCCCVGGNVCERRPVCIECGARGKRSNLYGASKVETGVEK